MATDKTFIYLKQNGSDEVASDETSKLMNEKYQFKKLLGMFCGNPIMIVRDRDFLD